MGSARLRLRIDDALVVVALEAIGQMDDLLGVVRARRFGDDEVVGDDVVDVGRPHAAGVAKVIDLHRRRLGREDGGPGVLRVAGEIDSDVDLLFAQQSSHFVVAERRGIDEMLEGGGYPSGHGAAIA